MKNLKEEAKQIFLATLNALDLRSLVNNELKLEDEILYLNNDSINLRDFREIVLIGFGKASLPVGAALEEILGDRISRGILVSDRRQKLKLKSEVIIAGHPLPDRNSLLAGKKILEILQTTTPDSLILFVVTGGGSATVEQAISDDISVEDLRDVNRLLVNCGATIREINIVRKHLSRIKGGRLGYLARKSSNIALFLSDVNPGDLRSIASNPLLPDEVKLEDFFDILEKYRLEEKLPSSILSLISKGEIPELPGAWSNEKKSINILLADNLDAIAFAARIARARGFQVETDSRFTEGDYKTVSRELIKGLLALKERFPDQPVCLVSGGEVSCPVRGDGTGGRNQEFVLYTALELSGLAGVKVAVLSCGTDGIDGNSTATGAVADSDLIKEADAQGIDATDFLARNDSHSFFKMMGGLVYTGPTGNNVRDVRILLAE
jgi:glycerate 2-kinase